MNKTALISACVACVGYGILGASRLPAGELYRLTDLGVLPDEISSIARAINNHGEIVGESGQDVFLWRDGEMTELWPFGQVFAINDSAQVVGRRNLFGLKAVLWEDDEITELETLDGANESFARDINEDGFIVGDINVPGEPLHAVIWDREVLLGVIFDARGNSINDNMQAAGASGSGPRALLWDNGFVEVIDDVRSVGGINNEGMVVGESGVSTGRQAYAWQDGELTLLAGLPRGVSKVATAINSHGWIVGISLQDGINSTAQSCSPSTT